jgi:hypothetical protein
VTALLELAGATAGDGVALSFARPAEAEPATGPGTAPPSTILGATRPGKARS